MRSSRPPGREDRKALEPGTGFAALRTPTLAIPIHTSHQVTLSSQDSTPLLHLPQAPIPPPAPTATTPPIVPSAWAQNPAFSFRPPSPQPSPAPAEPHLEMLLKTNWQNLGHGAVGGMGSSCHWGCGAAAARTLQGRGGERGGGRLGSARYSPGTQETGRQTRARVGGGGSRVRDSRNGGTGRSADSGNG